MDGMFVRSGRRVASGRWVVYKNVHTHYNKYQLKKECEEHNYG